MTHHMVDCYAVADDILPSERFPLRKLSDSEAVLEAKAHCSDRKLAWFQVRAVSGSGDDRIIHDSRNEA